jgi:predicted nucleotidyltransferase
VSDAGVRVRRARERAGLSQRELARRAGIHQPNVSAIERGRVVPSEETLRRLLDAVRVRPSVMLARQRERIRQIVAEHRGARPRVFGSVARGTDGVDSDIDLLVAFEPEADLLDAVAISLELEDLLGVHVDVVSDRRDNAVVEQARAEAVPV